MEDKKNIEWRCPVTGKKFGSLTVMYEYYNNKVKSNHHYCHCLCDCGNESDTSYANLQSGSTISCGHCRERGLIGKKFGRLTIKSLFYKQYKNCRELTAICDCDCHSGKSHECLVRSLLSGITKSCGCYNDEVRRVSKRKHGMYKSRIYEIWTNMKHRCYTRSAPNYLNYGGRGIKVCDRWKDSFENFRDDMMESYNKHVKEFGEKDTTIDRINVDMDYCRENCRWATYLEQASNKSNNHNITYKGETRNVTNWARLYNINIRTFRARLQYGWDIERALTTPVQKRNSAVK